MNPQEANFLIDKIVSACIEVHRYLGPGLLENAYRVALIHELTIRGLKVDTEVSMPAMYKGLRIELAYRVDIIVEDEIILELKATEGFHPSHKKQLLTYLRLSNKKVGLLLNFHGTMMKDGISRAWIDPRYAPPSSL